MERLRSIRLDNVGRYFRVGENLRPVSDSEYGRRDDLLRRIVRSVGAMPDTGEPGHRYLDVRLHPLDLDLLGHDVLGAERDINDLLGAGGPSVKVRELLPDPFMMRGWADVTPAAPVVHVRTRVATQEPEPEPEPKRPQPRKTAQARLIMVDGGPTLTIPATGGVIGRDVRRCDVVVDAPTVSRIHVQLAPNPSGFEVTDLESANGMAINSRFTTRGVLQPGDILGLGRTVRLRLDMDDQS